MVRVFIECSVTVDVEQEGRDEDLVKLLEQGKLVGCE